MKEIQASKVATKTFKTTWFDMKVLMQFVWTSIGLDWSKNLTTNWKRVQIFQKNWLNLDIECKNYNTLNWTWTYVETLFGPPGWWRGGEGLVKD